MVRLFLNRKSFYLFILTQFPRWLPSSYEAVLVFGYLQRYRAPLWRNGSKAGGISLWWLWMVTLQFHFPNLNGIKNFNFHLNSKSFPFSFNYNKEGMGMSDEPSLYWSLSYTSVSQPQLGFFINPLDSISLFNCASSHSFYYFHHLT